MSGRHRSRSPLAATSSEGHQRPLVTKTHQVTSGGRRERGYRSRSHLAVTSSEGNQCNLMKQTHQVTSGVIPRPCRSRSPHAVTSSERHQRNPRATPRQVTSALPEDDQAEASQGPLGDHKRPSRARFNSLYLEGELLGEGGFGSVHDGIRRADGQRVAIKYINKRRNVKNKEDYIKIPRTSRRLPREVALMTMTSEPSSSEHVLRLIDWFDLPDQLILVLERPDPCIDVSDYIWQQEGHMLPEHLARSVMRQTVLAAQHCDGCGVLHRDIKGENLLVNTETMQVKLIDFGCGDLLKESSYREFAGTDAFCPPEWLQHGRYRGRHATVWSLGILLFEMVSGDVPFETLAETVAGHLSFGPVFSPSCKDLVTWCLAADHVERPDLAEILQHPWFSEESCRT